MTDLTANANCRENKGIVDCDQMAWLINVLERYERVVRLDFAGVSRIRPMAKIAALLEIMDTLNLEPDGKGSWGNLISVSRELSEGLK